MEHRFVLQTDHLELRLRLRDLGQEPVAGAACTLAAGGEEKQLMTNGEGGVNRSIARSESQAVLTLGDEKFDIVIGELDPIPEPTGWQARLVTLGYLEARVRVIDGGHELSDEDRREIRAAVEEFQCDNHARSRARWTTPRAPSCSRCTGVEIERYAAQR